MDLLPPKDLMCHRTGFEKSCRLLVAEGKCNRWKTLEGVDPETLAPMVRSDCVDNWSITLLIDLAGKLVKGTSGVQAATESFRNAMMVANGMIPPAQPKQLNGDAGRG